MNHKYAYQVEFFFFFSGFIVFIRLKNNETEHNKTFASVQPITVQ
jgi:hypothetical protein